MSTIDLKKEIATVLRRALGRLGPNGEHWIQGAGARDEDGRLVEQDNDAGPAVCWCASGAIIASEKPPFQHYEKSKAWEFFVHSLGNNIVTWNDATGRTFGEVKAEFIKAIAKAEGKSRKAIRETL